jgi:hypothetical protein
VGCAAELSAPEFSSARSGDRSCFGFDSAFRIISWAEIHGPVALLSQNENGGSIGRTQVDSTFRVARSPFLGLVFLARAIIAWGVRENATGYCHEAAG